jgi:hypothetical protein
LVDSDCIAVPNPEAVPMARPGIPSSTSAALLGALLLAGCGSGGTQGGTGTGTTRYPELGVFLDNAFFNAHGVDSETEALAIVNAANSYFANSGTLVANPVVVILVGQHTFVGTGDPWPAPATEGDAVAPVDLLQKFSTHVQGNPPFAFDIGILISGRQFTHGVIGLSYWKSACGELPAYGIVHAFDLNRPLTAAVLAREIGNILGMCSDPPGFRDSTCPDLSAVEGGAAACRGGIMNWSIDPNDPPTRFSACSALDLDTFLASVASGPGCYTAPR